jgi:hypothetical protein
MAVAKVAKACFFVSNPKVETGYGYWGIWLKDNFKFSQGTAAYYIDYAHYVKFLPVGKNLTYAQYRILRKQEAKKQKNPASARTQSHQEKPDSAGQTNTSTGDAKRQAAKPTANVNTKT